MRGENELLSQIKGLKNIQPRKEWIASTKNEILKEESVLSFGSLFRPAVAGVVTLCLFGGVFVFAQNSLPGDSLYTFKKVVEKARVSLLPEKERPSFQLELANEKLESLVVVVQSKNIDKVDPIIKEYQATVAEAAKALTKIEKPDVREIVAKTKKIEETKERIEALGVKIGETKDLDEALSRIVEHQIKELEEITLSEEQIEIFEEIQKDYQEGKYSEALEKILLLSYPQEK